MKCGMCKVFELQGFKSHGRDTILHGPSDRTGSHIKNRAAVLHPDFALTSRHSTTVESRLFAIHVTSISPFTQGRLSSSFFIRLRYWLEGSPSTVSNELFAGIRNDTIISPSGRCSLPIADRLPPVLECSGGRRLKRGL